MHASMQTSSLPGNQRGATLFVALIMLVLISLIGVTALKSASVVERMSSNDYEKNRTFQASESAVNLTLQNDDLITEAINANGAPVEKDVVNINLDHAKAKVTFTTAGVGPVDGNSLGEGGVGGQRIMITAVGEIDGAANISTTTVHGIVKLIPNGAGG